jgi:hypothetical protein
MAGFTVQMNHTAVNVTQTLMSFSHCDKVGIEGLYRMYLVLISVWLPALLPEGFNDWVTGITQ